MSGKITVIPARSRESSKAKIRESAKMKVAAYCRVSTDSDEQATSYEAQVEHYTEYIQSNPQWECAGIFADDGISGTNTKNRTEFNRMIEECMAGKIDMIVTKSISRFARNTLDCLKYIRQLKDLGIPVYFEKESINTMDAKGEVLLTIMASLAHQESQSLSQNVKLGCQYRYQQGKVQVNHTRFLGYTKDADGNLIIEPSEAETVKRIYREYLEGASLLDIAKSLEHDGILTGAGMKRWRPESVKTILRNEKYIGDALLQKTYTVDFLTKKRVKNDGIVPQYYVEGCHEAIIPKGIYMRVQEEMFRRSHMKIKGHRRIYSSRYALSGVVICGVCGDIYRRVVWTSHGKRLVVWRCVNRVNGGKKNCCSRTIREDELKGAVVKAMKEVFGKKELYLDTIKDSAREVLSRNHSKALGKVETALAAKQEELLGLIKSAGDCDAIADEIDKLRNEKEEILLKEASDKGMAQRLNQMTDFIDSYQGEIVYDEQIVRKFIDKITVYEWYLTVMFKSGICIDIFGDTLQ